MCAALLVLGIMFTILSSRELLIRMFLTPPVAEVSTLLLFVMKELGGIMLMLAALLWLAARDPVRNIAIIDAFIFGFCVLAVTPNCAGDAADSRDLSRLTRLGAQCNSAGDRGHVVLAAAASTLRLARRMTIRVAARIP